MNTIFSVLIVALVLLLFYVVLPVALGYFAPKAGWAATGVISIFFVIGVMLGRG